MCVRVQGCTHFFVSLGCCVLGLESGLEWMRKRGMQMPLAQEVRQTVTWNGLLSPQVSSNS